MTSKLYRFSSSTTLSSFASLVRVKSAELPSVTSSFTCLMKPSSIPMSPKGPVSAHPRADGRAEEGHKEDQP
jgi:hypothetical protein